jgi:neurofibromin 1
MVFCFRMYGQYYLKDLLNPLIMEMFETNLSYEVDAARLEEGETVDENRKNLMDLTQRVFNAIVASSDKFPPKLRSMCHCLYQVVTQRFQQSSIEAVWTVIGTILFLRFINPAIGM